MNISDVGLVLDSLIDHITKISNSVSKTTLFLYIYLLFLVETFGPACSVYVIL